jgi:Tol biopolymer transport system component
MTSMLLGIGVHEAHGASKIAFHSYRAGLPDIYVMEVDGSNQVNLTGDASKHDVFPGWSPDACVFSVSVHTEIVEHFR